MRWSSVYSAGRYAGLCIRGLFGPDYFGLCFGNTDPRRADALDICKEYTFSCVDISRFIYERSLTRAKIPTSSTTDIFPPRARVSLRRISLR
jgi:hypothetical protein